MHQNYRPRGQTLDEPKNKFIKNYKYATLRRLLIGSAILILVALSSFPMASSVDAAGIQPTDVLQNGYALFSCFADDPNEPALAIIDLRPAGTLHDDTANHATDNATAVTVHSSFTKPITWTLSAFGGSQIMGTAFDRRDGTIYVSTSAAYEDNTSSSSPEVWQIAPSGGTPVLFATLPGNQGTGWLDIDEDHDQLYVSNFDDGLIYVIDITVGPGQTSSNPNPNSSSGSGYVTFIPNISGYAADDINEDPNSDPIMDGLPPLGNRIWGIGYNEVEKRLYYAVWSKDFTGTAQNTIRSVAINPDGTINSSSDQEEIAQLDHSVTLGSSTLTTQMPVSDIDFSQDGTIMLLAEQTFDSIEVPLTTPAGDAHHARVLEFRGTSGNWVAESATKHKIGSFTGGEANARGGVSFAYHSLQPTGLITATEEYIIATGDALVNHGGLAPPFVYGLQYHEITGGDQSNSLKIDVDGDLVSGAGDKYLYGDIDVRMERRDYGDLPDDYDTLDASGGAYHLIVDNVTYLGAGVDAEGDGQPSVNADGDDNNDDGTHASDLPDDEDGVTFNSPIMAGELATITVSANITGYLNAWIDFNGNNTFDVGENIAADQMLIPGNNTLTFTAPSTVAEELYSRFRFTNGEGQATSPDGGALNGEVEDYVLMSLGNRVWFDNGPGGNGDNGQFDANEQAVPGVEMALYDVSNTLIATTTTNASGYYSFTGLISSTYTVEVAAINFQSNGPLEGYLSTTGVEGGDTIDSTSASSDNGIDAANPAATGIRSNTIILELGDEPTGEETASGTDNSENSNLTVDFGFLRRDWGDLPDGNASGSPNYKTLDANSGPSHIIVPGLYMGTLVDEETDGQPDAAAEGDDNAGTTDDEDGVTLPAFTPGATVSVDVDVVNSSNVNATVYGFIDFNGDGDFDDTGEVATPVSAPGTGTYPLSFNVPANADTTQLLGARFRITSDTQPTPFHNFATGPASDGEVEDYLITTLREEYGDLPDVYGTINAGTVLTPAVHTITDTLSLGSVIDSDGNGTASVGADGDDTADGTDDEDGITFLTPIMPGQPVNIQVTATITGGPSNSAWVGAWIDLDGNGTFTGTSEYHLLELTSGASGIATGNISIPAAPATISDTIYSRFRIAYDQTEVDDQLTDHVGNAATGEVEDYVLMSLGNRVWLDNGPGNANNGAFDTNETGIGGVTVDLLDATGTTLIAQTTTASDGTYLFTGLISDTYIVRLPASNFGPSQPLENMASSTDATGTGNVDPDTDTDDEGNDENGVDQPLAVSYQQSGISSQPITLEYGAEPPATTDGNGVNSNLTVDFGLVEYDWGDLPETGQAIGSPDYNTIVTNTGPSHVIVPGLFMGNIVDAETDGQPDGTAEGDDTTGAPDDEDGVTFPAFYAGKTADVDVTVTNAYTTAATLYGFIDFDGDGAFTGPGETATVSVPGSSSSVVATLTFTVPATADTDQLLGARFRLTTDPPPATLHSFANGPASDGEVEDYLISVFGLEYGDLPDNYGTTVAGTAPISPAVHIVTDTLKLGSVIDSDTDGADSVGADGDDTGDGTDDEDGVTFLTPIMTGEPVNIQITATITGGPNNRAWVGAWIDLDGNGTFTGTNEYHLLELTSGASGIATANINFTEPNAISDTVYSRFRIAYDQTEVDDQLTDHVGNAATGEVEDYVLMSLGNRVWLDDGAGTGTANDGIFDAGQESGLENVVVELYKDGDTPGTSTPVATTTTDGNGNYLFTGLQPDDYIVHLPAANFGTGQPLEGLLSTTDPAAGSIDPDNDTDEGADENGTDNVDPTATVGGGISSKPVTLVPDDEPTRDGNGTNSNLTVDFGLIYYDLALIKTRSAGQDYAIDFSNSPLVASYDIVVENQGPTDIAAATVLDTIPPGMTLISINNVALATPITGTRTLNIGNLAAGNRITFTLVMRVDDLGYGTYTNIAEISDMQDANGMSVSDIDSVADSDPTNDAIDTSTGVDPLGTDDDNSHNALNHQDTDDSAPGNIIQPTTDEDDHDQEVIVGGLALGNRVWYDTDNDGLLEAGESGIENVVVEAYKVDGSGNIVGTAVNTDTTDANGYWLIENLPPGAYKVVVPASNFAGAGALVHYYSSGDLLTDAPATSESNNPDDDTENDDNGIDALPDATDGIQSGVITLTVTSPEPLDSNASGLETDLGPGNVISHTAAGDVFDNLLVDFGFVRYDLGDLPDSYSTTLNNATPNAGAHHLIDDVTYLGNSVDAESDGQPSPLANGDDAAGTPDDEDGVTFDSPIMPNEIFTITVSASITGYLNAWIDFDGNGTLDSGERIFATDEALSAGPNVLTFTAPGSVDDDDLYSRFRFTSGTGQATDPHGPAPNGEVEDYVLMSLGNRVWLDDGAAGTGTANDGQMNGNEAPIENVTVQLLDSGGAVIAETTTNSTGHYTFTGLISDTYTVHIPAINFQSGQPLEKLASSTGAAAPDADNEETLDEDGIDSNDPATTGISSQPVTLSDGNEPGGTNGNVNPTVDFGFVPYDLSLIKVRSAGFGYAADFSNYPASPPFTSFDVVVKNQGVATVTQVSVVDVIPAGMSMTSFNGGPSLTPPITGTHSWTIPQLTPGQMMTYTLAMNIDDLSHGIYPNQAEITDMKDIIGTDVLDIDSDMDTNISNDPLSPDPANPDDEDNSHNDIDHDRSNDGNYTPVATPDDEDDHDQEIVVGGLALGNRVWYDANDSGTIDGSEQGIENVLVEVYEDDGTGNPLGTPVGTDITDANGYWLVDNLPPGDYLAIVPASNFTGTGALVDMFSSSDIGSSAGPNNDTESDDNGIGSIPGTGGISSGVVSLDPVVGEPTQGGDEGDLGPGHGNAGDPFDNLTLDFGFIQYDLGDLPDSYGTTTANSGASHVLDGVTYLGASVDSETDGQPSMNADGDDTPTGIDTADDEDGVTFNTPIMAGEVATITVNASTAGALNAWMDFNGNGTLEAGEQVFTDEMLTAGNNVLTFTAPASVDDDNLYSRFRFTDSAGKVTSPTGSVISGEVEDYVLLGLGDTVWYDSSTLGPNNGLLDGTEAGIEGVTLELLDSTGTVVATTTTDANGEYLFTGLTPGNYMVHIPADQFAPGAALEDLFSSTPTTFNANDNTDNDDNGIDPANLADYLTDGLSSGVITLDINNEPTTDGDGSHSNRTVDFGLIQYDMGDLRNGYGTLNDTASDGPRHLIVDGIHLGNGVDPERDGQPSAAADGDDTPTDGDTADDEDGVAWANITGLGAGQSTLIPGETVVITVTASANGFLHAWMDLDGDGAFNSIVAGTDEHIADNLPITAGVNTITLVVPPADQVADDVYSRFRFTSEDLGPGGLDPTGVTADGTAPDGEVEDYLIPVRSYSVGNRVWHDVDGDGLINGSEAGIDNVTVNLLDDNGNVLATTTTNGGGYYRFDDLPAGDYQLEIPASNFAPGAPLEEMFNSLPTEADPDGDGDSNDNGINESDPAANGVLSDLVTLDETAGDEPLAADELDQGPAGVSGTGPGLIPDQRGNLTVDFGFFAPVTVGDLVWVDNDYDGEQDASEPGVPNVTVNLFNGDGTPAVDGGGNPVASETTDSNGNYLFEDLPPGDYYVIFDTSTLPGGAWGITHQDEPGVADDEDSDADQNTGQSHTTAFLNSGEEDLTLDAGIWAPVRVGDRVWYDDNRDGIQDPGEAGVENVLATLYDTATNTPVLDQFGVPMIDLTDANGEYLFENLPPSDYYVEFQLSTLPANYVVTQADQGTDDSVDSDADPSTGRVAPTGFMLPNTEDLTLDMGIYQLEAVRVGNRVWYDTGLDGLQDGSEPGVPGVTVTLIDNAGNPVTQDRDGNPIVPAVTDANGFYLFENLPPGDYAVIFDLSTLPPNYVPTSQDTGSDDALDSDADPVTGESGTTGPLADGEEDLTLDMGIYELGGVRVGDRVWYDNDNDGVQDLPADEPGVENVTVTLYDAVTGTPVTQDRDGNPVTPEVTDANGDYLFENLPEGDYYVVFDLNTLPAGYEPTSQDSGSDDAEDSDADPTTGQTASTGPLAFNEEDLTLDLGIVAPVSIGDRVWYDNDKDGKQDAPADEPGVENVTVYAFHADGTPVTTDMDGNAVTPQVTDANGEYLFENLAPGDYYVQFDLATLPANYVVTIQDVGIDDAVDSDGDPSTGETATTGFLPANSEDLTLDLGIIELAGVRVGDRVWFDDNVNGLQDNGEPGVPNVMVNLFNADGTPVTSDMDGNPVGTMMTDINGNYFFGNLLPGDYYVEFDLSSLPAGSIVTLQDATSNQPSAISDQQDSDADPTTGETAPTGPLAAGEEDLTLDLGIYQLASIGDTVWYDEDADGIQDPSESGVEGVTVELFEDDGTPATDVNGNPMTTTTDPNGNYEFTDLLPGDYYVEFTPPAGYEITYQDVTSGQPSAISDQQDSDADPVTGQTEVTTLTSGENDPTWDAGIYELVTVGDRVWYDEDKDGIQDAPADEPGVEGVTVNIFNSDGTPVTDSAGNPVGPEVTDSAGNYLFEELPPGDYYVVFDLSTLPAGYDVTSQDATSGQPSAISDQQDSDADPTTGRTGDTGFLPGGEEDLTLDMGIHLDDTPDTVTVGDRVWYDNDEDGIQDAPADEPGVQGVTVNIFNSDGTPVTDVAGNPVGPEVTDSDGNYLFEELPEGDYYVVFDLSTLPAGYDVTSQDATSGQPSAISDQQDSDADPTTGRTDDTGFLAGGEEDLTLDMGIVVDDSLDSVAVGDRVWYDNDEDGVQDAPADEPGVQGVTVNIFNSDGTPVTDVAGNPVGPEVTDSDGNYLFEELPEGDYYVVFDLSTLPVGYDVTSQDSGTDDAEDSDADPSTGRTDDTGFLAGGEEDLTLDMGIVVDDSQDSVAVGDRVWYDNDEDGVQDSPADEPGVQGVTVNIFNSDGTPVTDVAGNPVGPEVTDSDGNYLFEELPEGDYYVVFDLSTLPAGYDVTSQDATSGQPSAISDQQDSDADPSTGRTGDTGFLVGGEEDLTLDMGIHEEEPSDPNTPESVTVGNRVWYDEDQDGLQDAPADEPGVEGVTVNIFNSDGTPVTDVAGNPVGPEETDSNGYYLFEDLPPGDYYVAFDLSTLPAGYVVTSQDSGSDDADDSDADPTTGQSADTGFLPDGTEDLTLDMGIHEDGSSEPTDPGTGPGTAPVSVMVGDRVWYDNDGDGLQDDGLDPSSAEEPGVEGVTVTLFDGDGNPVTDVDGNPVGPQETDENGDYLFDNLPEGDYYVVFDLATLPEDYEATEQNAIDDEEPATSDQADSDGHPTSGRTPTTDELAAGEADLTLDLGIVAPVSLGDRVWLDEDSDGVQDAGEEGVEDVTVMLFNADGTPVTDMDGNPVGPQETDENGNYLFENLPPGDYYVQFDLSTLPDGYGVTEQDSGSDDAEDSDADPTTGRTEDTGFLVSNSHDPSLDMGIVELGEVVVGDLVWYDDDRDGVQDADENGVENVVAMLFNADGSVVNDMDGNPVGPEVTDSNGNYLFDNLPPGDYYVWFDEETLPDNYVITNQDATSDQPSAISDQQDSDVNPNTGRTADTGFLPASSEDLTLDMGIFQIEPVTIGNRVWYDNDDDGIQDDPTEEPGVEGVTVTVYNADGTPVTDMDGNPVAPVTTDENGEYLFENLEPGDYYVEFDLTTIPEDYSVTEPNAGDDDSEDSDASPSTGTTGVVSVESGENLSLDMGIVESNGVRVGDIVWLDEDRDGIQDEGEPGVSGVSVTLYEVLETDPIATTVTDEDGNYLFDDLPPGDYYVIFDLDTLPPDHVVTLQDSGDDDGVDSDVDPEDGQSGTTGILFGGEEDLTLDMGIYSQGNVRVGNYVWYDNDQDGIQDEGETGVAEVDVSLYDVATDTLLDTTTTDEDGYYIFEELPAGDYYVVFDLDTLPVGYVPTVQNATDDQLDSDADPATGQTMPTDVLFDGEEDLTLDMGIYQLPGVEIGTTVWFDDDGDGIEDPSESGVPNVTVTVIDAITGEPVLDEQGEPLQTVTDPNGEYRFTDLPPGQYAVIFDLETIPEEYEVSEHNPESGIAEVDPITGQTTPTEILINGEEDLTLDMGIWKPVKVGDTVWYDNNGNGLQDPDEEGVANVTATLYNSDTSAPVTDDSGTPLTVVTDENGNYLFDALPPGDYYVTFDLTTLPDGYIVTNRDMTDGGDPADHLDSDANPTTGQTPPTGMIPSGEQNLTLDMGIVRPVEVGNLVWLDSDVDGVQDEEEEGVPGIGVTLYNSETGEPVTDGAGNPLTTVTDESGNYLFSDLPPGDYYVVFDLTTLPEEHAVTQPNAEEGAGDDSDDSDANPGTGATGSTGFLTDGATDYTLDMGIHPLEEIRVGGTLWIEENNNGQVDESERVLPSVTVELYEVSDPETPVASEVTDENGYFLFESVPEGEYFTQIVPETLPEDVIIPDLIMEGSDDLRTTGLLEDNDEAVRLDMPVILPGSLNGQVWFDENGDGLQPEGENGLEGIPVRIYNEQGDLVAETVTDEQGNYDFPTLLPGLYQVEYGTPEGYGTSPVATDDTLKAHPGPKDDTVRTELILVGAGDDVDDVDLGLYQGASIGNLIWDDLNGDGVQDEGEPGLPEIFLQLFTTNDELVAETTTDENGNYIFSELVPGDYYLAIPQDEDRIPGLRNELDFDAEEESETLRTSTISVEPGSDTDIEISLVQPSALGNLVWLDTNKNGIYDANEAGVSSVTVWLYDSEGELVATTQTDSNGHFEFVVPAGEYQVHFDLPEEMRFTFRYNGEEHLDSNVNSADGKTDMIVLIPGQTDSTIDAGLMVHPTAIQLMSLLATNSNYGVRIEWATGTEFQTFGYELYRSRDGSFENAIQVTESMVLARGDDTVYSFVDSTAHAEQIYTYWLVEVQNDGTVYRYGPTDIITSQPDFVTFLPLIQR